MRFVAAILDHHFGRCPKCMRKAVLSALFAWLLARGALAYGSWSWLALSTIGLAIGLTVLWIAHVIVFAVRSTAILSVAQAENHGRVDDLASTRLQGRRNALIELAKASTIVALATALSSLKAFATDACGDDWTLTNGVWTVDCVDDNGRNVCYSCPTREVTSACTKTLGVCPS